MQTRTDLSSQASQEEGQKGRHVADPALTCFRRAVSLSTLGMGGQVRYRLPGGGVGVLQSR
jgi:hypothetical protein